MKNFLRIALILAATQSKAEKPVVLQCTGDILASDAITPPCTATEVKGRTIVTKQPVSKIVVSKPGCHYEYGERPAKPSPDIHLHHYDVAFNAFNAERVTFEPANATSDLYVRKAVALAEALNQLEIRTKALRIHLVQTRGTAFSESCGSCPGEDIRNIGEILALVHKNEVTRQQADIILREWSGIEKQQIENLIDVEQRAIDDDPILRAIVASLNELCAVHEKVEIAKPGLYLYVTPRFPYQDLLSAKTWEIVAPTPLPTAPQISARSENSKPPKHLLLGASLGLILAPQNTDRFEAAPLTTGGYQIVVSREKQLFHGVIALGGWLTDDHQRQGWLTDDHQPHHQHWVELLVVPSASPPAVGLGGAYSWGHLKADAGVLFSRERSLSGHSAGDVVTGPSAVVTRSRIAVRFFVGISILCWKGY
jgi:hypothetical protein